jgi:DNA-binding transcriptional LysR family regulator
MAGFLHFPETTMDRLESMSILLTVAEAGSLSAGARRLNTPLTTVSRKISDLEHHLTTQLLTRSSRRMVLTDTPRFRCATD